MEQHKETTEIQRKSPQIDIKLGEQAITLTWYNTMIQLYPSPYHDLSHVEVVDPSIKLMMFDSTQTMGALMSQKFPIRLDQEPSNLVLENYARFQQQNLDAEIEKLLDQ